jgi:hypothetical protein
MLECACPHKARVLVGNGGGTQSEAGIDDCDDIVCIWSNKLINLPDFLLKNSLNSFIPEINLIKID